MYLLLKLGYLIIIFTAVEGVRKCYNTTLQKPIISALIDIRSGGNCNVVNYHGLQQVAALESTMKQINHELKSTGIELVLQIFDTCSKRETAQKAALKALVASNQTCIKTPLFLGFVGPENMYSLHTVHDITFLFRIPHVIFYSFDKPSRNNVFNVAKYPINQHTKVVELLLKKLGLQRVVILTEDNYISKWKAQIIKEKLDTRHCLSQPITIKKGRVGELISGLEDFTAILAIIESTDLVEWILNDLKYINSTILISIGRAGFINWPEPMNNVYIIQMISSSPIDNLNEIYDPVLLKEFSNQMLSKCERTITGERILCDPMQGVQQDWTVNLLQYSLLLYSSNLHKAYNLKCQNWNRIGLCPKLKYITRTEWSSMLSKISYSFEERRNINVTFNMDINVTFTIMMPDDNLVKIAEYKNEKLIDIKNYFENDVNITEECIPFKRRSYTNKIYKPYYDNASIFDNVIDLRTLSYYQLVGMLCGVGIGITIILCLVFYSVYRGVNVKSNRSSGSSTMSRSVSF